MKKIAEMAVVSMGADEMPVKMGIPVILPEKRKVTGVYGKCFCWSL